MNEPTPTGSLLHQERLNAFLRVFIVGVAFLAGCRKTPSVPPSESASQTKKTPNTYDDIRNLIKMKGLSPERENAALQSIDDMKRQADQGVLDHNELVIPAPSGFKPEVAKKKLRLTLTLEKTIIRRKEAPRFRLEMTNVGREPITYNELHGSFFKTGALSMSRDMQFLLIPPAGKEFFLYTGALGSGTAQEIVFPADWSEEKKSLAVKEMNDRSKAESTLSIDLLPGEILRTRGEFPGDSFRTLTSNADYSRTGTYRLRVRFERNFALKRIEPWMSAALQEDARKRRAEELIAPVDSNEVRFEVAP